MVSFTGSTRAGKRVSELAAGTVKRVALELGGKSPNVILDDADLARAVPDGVAKAFLNSGQTCSALTRMLVPRAKLAEAEALAAGTAEAFAPADPFGERNGIGPLVSDVAARARARLHPQGRRGGRALVTGGAEPPEDLPQEGFYVRPTVFADVTPEMTIAREEIFGPVLVLIPYDTEEDAVRIANDTIYGLAAGVWSGDADAPSASRGGCAPARSRSTAAASTCAPRSAASSSRATGARTASSGSRSTSRRRRCSAKQTPRARWRRPRSLACVCRPRSLRPCQRTRSARLDPQEPSQ